MKAAYGVSKSSDSKLAAQEAVDACMARLEDAAHAFAVMVYFGIDHDAAVIATTLAEKLPNVTVVGCSTDGEISSDGLSVDSVCVCILSSTKTTARAALIADYGQDSQAAGARIARELAGPNARALVLLPDGLSGNGSAVIRGAAEVLGAQFSIAGGTAGDRGRFNKTWQIFNGQAVTGGLVGLMFDSPQPLRLGTGVMSGWRPIGIAKTVTKAVGNVVYTIENESALDVYSSFLGDKASQLPAIGVEYPFGLVDETGFVDTRGVRQGEEYTLLRAAMAVDRQTGAVTFAGEIPQGAKIKMTRAKSQDVIDGAKEAATRCLTQVGGTPDVVFFFSCMARKVVLGRKTHQEIEAAQQIFGGTVPMAGFYSYGEIANCGDTHPVCRFHNETATFLAIREEV